MDIREYLDKNRMIADGALGTWYDRLTGYSGELAERGNLTHPELIKDIHYSYIEAGAKLIRANTFAVNSMFFEREEIPTVIQAAWKNANDAVKQWQSEQEDTQDEEIWIAADMGPINESETRSSEDIIEEYCRLSQIFLNLGAEVFVFETLANYKYILDAINLIKSQKPDAFIITQFSFNRNGYTGTGESVEVILSRAAVTPEINAVGFNCGVGPLHLYDFVKDLAFPEGKYITALPNAGYPTELRGRVLYSENVPYFVEMMGKIANVGVDIVGGCCGTTPRHIEALCNFLENGIKPPKKLMPVSLFSKSERRENQLTPFMEKLQRGEKVFIVELDPPFDANDKKLMDGAARLHNIDVDMITIADSPLARPRADAVAAAVKMHYTQQIEAMPHISCRDKNMIAHRAQLIGMQMNGLRHALVVTGDPVARGERDIIKSVFNFNSIKLMKYIQTMNQEVFGDMPIYYGGALNHNNGSVDHIAARMRQKMEAGASWFLTQPIYGDEDLERLRTLKEKSGGKILAGIMPLVSRKNALFIRNEMPGIRVPDEVLKQYEEGMSREQYEEIAVSISLDLIRKSKDICDGYYFMTPFNRASLIERIILKAKGE